MDKPSSLSLIRWAISTPPGKGRSAQAIANASLWKSMFCAVTVVVGPYGVIAALVAGAAVTVWNGPLVVMGGEIGRAVIAPPLAVIVAVATKSCNWPVDWKFCGLTP